MQDQDQDKLIFPENFGDDEIYADESDKERFECIFCGRIVRDPLFCTNLNCGKPFCKIYCLKRDKEESNERNALYAKMIKDLENLLILKKILLIV